MKRNFVYLSDSSDAHTNMATDEWFLKYVKDEDLILHVYQNENAVIIGKGQNPFVECDLQKMKADGVQLARRLSGGGAVYHDSGNLNFSFICGKARFEKEELLGLVVTALEELGIICERSGRNDLLCEGKKFSGNAVADHKGAKLFHGTLLISGNLEKLSSYLTVDPKKIRAKGVASVRSRVCNLSEFCPDLTVKEVQKRIVKVFADWGGYYGEFAFSAREWEEVEELILRHRDPAWYLGQTPKFDFEFRERLPWGSVQLCILAEKGRIASVKAFSDAMDPQLCDAIENTLLGVFCDNGSIAEAFQASERPELKLLAKYRFL
ncbi:MAG: lipoate--protein ligase [Clostridia bacterium]|nr:lipoate--protein ligase [Clostridia bacterium]